MQGLSPCIDDHATMFASNRKTINQFVRQQKDFGEQTNQQETQCEDDASDDHPRVIGLWKRYLSTVLTGAYRYGDRLFAAGILTDGKCPHPACRREIVTAEHWLYECPLNNTARNTTGAAVQDLNCQNNDKPKLWARPCPSHEGSLRLPFNAVLWTM